MTTPRGTAGRQAGTAAEPGRKPGRPRSDGLCRAIRGAALELVVRDGFAALTIESIAAHAGVGKATIYRRWPKKGDLVVDAFFEGIAPRVRFGDSGSLREDIRQQMRLIAREMSGTNGRVLAIILACAQMDEGLAESFRARWLALRSAEGRQAVARGIERGELPRGTDPDLVLDALYSPFYFRLLVRNEPITPIFADRMVDLVFDGIAGARRGDRKTRKASAGAAGKAHAEAVRTRTPRKSKGGLG